MILPGYSMEFCEPDGPPSSISHARIRKAFLELLPRAEKLEAKDFATINLQVPGVVTTVLGCLPKVVPLAEEIAEQLPRFPISYVTELKTYALALSFAHAQYIANTKPTEGLPEVATSLAGVRDMFNNDIRALAARGILSDSVIATQNGTTGYQNIAFDILATTAVLRGSWHRIEGRTTISMAEIDDAEAKAYSIANALGERDHAGATLIVLAERRVRFFTLLSQAYDEVRRAVSFLRWKVGDADDFAPSLYAGRSSPRKADPDPTTTPGGTAPGGTAPGGTTAGGAPATGGTTTAGSSGAAPTNGTTTQPTATGSTAAPAGASSTTGTSAPAQPVVTTTASMNNGTLSVETSTAPGMPGHEPFTR